MNQMKQAVKFTFDTQFDAPASRSAADASAHRKLTADDIEQARNEAFASGFAAGEAEAKAHADSQIHSALNELASSAASLLAAMDIRAKSLTTEAVQLAIACAMKLAPATMAMRPEAEIEGVVRDCLSHLNREPHILLRVSATIVDRLKDVVDHMAMERGLTGRIILLGEPEMSDGDCVVEWADGGVTRSREDIEKEIAEIVARYVATLVTQDNTGLAMTEFGTTDSNQS